MGAYDPGFHLGLICEAPLGIGVNLEPVFKVSLHSTLRCLQAARYDWVQF